MPDYRSQPAISRQLKLTSHCYVVVIVVVEFNGGSIQFELDLSGK